MTGRVDQEVLSPRGNIALSDPAKSYPHTIEPEWETHLRFQVPMNIPQLVQLIHTHEHLRRVESSVFFLEDAGVVEEGSEVSSGDVFLPP